MCLLTFLPEGQEPDVDALEYGAFVNDDGHGWAIVADDELLVGHGMNAEQVITEFAAVRRRHPEGPAIFHSRFTTHGVTTVDNCHPFFVGKDRRTVLAHNGVLPANVQPKKGDPRSDTRIAAEKFIPKTIGSLHLRRNRLRVEKWMGSWNKIAILTVNPRYRENAFILNENEGIWDDGIWYSNSGYTWRHSTTRYGFTCNTTATEPASSYKRWWEEGITECPGCKAIVDTVGGYCRYCLTCFDCGMDIEESCLCYVPTKSSGPIVLGSSSTAKVNGHQVSLGTATLGESVGTGWPKAGE